ncbi:MAG TPA: antibiotic biosynthesis monooxygenase [Vicinamibacteria bacterium]|nr:antibiotic biosynthesis monooxygenase [Vicinamibacteria bacterium]
MLIILFRSRLTEEAGEDYLARGEEMLAHAKTQPGFVDYKQYQSDDGERLTVVRWKDEETLEQWRIDAKHQTAKKRGRERWYRDYQLEIAKVFHESRFERPTEP